MNSNCKILIIDDDEDVRESLIALLNGEGYDAAGAHSGLAALTTMTWQRYLPDVILLDLIMPTMDGEKFHAVVQKHPRWSRIPILLCTGNGAPVTIPVFGVLQKPFDLDEMLALIKNACACARPPA